ncbi:MAG TPA: hypothetical protein VJZ00_01340 [Thermoanaerobaculia bacterium]|nr:hypothetical protein [Thermoanaerobaculia bacterium]
MERSTERGALEITEESAPKLIFLPVNLTVVTTAVCDEYAPIAAAKTSGSNAGSWIGR